MFSRSLDELKNILLLEFDLEFAEQRKIFILEGPSTMMFFLILYVANYGIEL